MIDRFGTCITNIWYLLIDDFVNYIFGDLLSSPLSFAFFGIVVFTLLGVIISWLYRVGEF